MSVLTIALLGAAPSQPPAAGDRFPEVIGTWSCRTAYRDPVRLYIRRDRAAIVVREEVHYAHDIDIRTDRYRPASDGRGWRAETDDDSGFEGSGPAWTGDTWTLDGHPALPRAWKHDG
jgi:hypothetical protein